MILDMSQTCNDNLNVKISYQLAREHQSQTCHESIYQHQNKLPTNPSTWVLRKIDYLP